MLRKPKQALPTELRSLVSQRPPDRPAAPTMPAFAVQPGTLRPNNFQIQVSAGLDTWLQQQNACFAFTTYQTGQVIVIGRKADQSLQYTVRTYEHAMGLAAKGNELHLATLYQVWHFVNRSALGAPTDEHYDAVYVPRSSHVTGEMKIHDVVAEDSGRLLFVNTAYGCIGELVPGYSFRPFWKLGWITELVPEDRCHLNGLGLRDGKARYITAVSRANEKDGWRKVRTNGGVLWDIQSDQPVLEGLSMPHSPRWHNGHIWFINSGSGYLCRVNPETHVKEEVAFIPGFSRGLALIGDYALVGTSEQRQNRIFSDLELDKNLASRGLVPRCAIHIINTATGQIEHQVTLSGDLKEIYDICIFPNMRMANVIGFLNDDVKGMIDIAPPIG